MSVKAPSTFALAFMTTYFTERGAQTTGAELPLRFPLPAFVVDGLTIEKRVKLHLNYHGGSGEPLRIGWRPIGAGPLPGFDGTVSAEAAGDTSSRLTISGNYTPPGGIAGIAFDQFIGVHIAGATLTALLEHFAGAIEAEYLTRVIG
jgi:hypothetical protein